MRYIVLDTETTGLDPSQGHRIIEIGCVEVVGRQITGQNFHTYLNPERDIDEGAQAVHGLSREFLSDYPVFSQQVDDFLNFISGASIIIHNAAFDVKFLDAELARLNRQPFSHYCHEVIDTLTQARELHPGKRNSLDALCDRYGISNAHRTLHGALLDSELLAEVWLAMTRGQNTLVIDAEPDQRRPGESAQARDGSAWDLPIAHAPEEDLAAHEAYLNGLDKAAKGISLWRKLLQADSPVN